MFDAPDLADDWSAPGDGFPAGDAGSTGHGRGDGGGGQSGPAGPGDGVPAGDGKDAAPKVNQATALVRLAVETYKAHVDEDGTVWAEDRKLPGLVVPLRGSDALRQRLAADYYDAHGRTAGSGALTDALTVIAGKAQRGAPVTVELRSAEQRGAVFVDLGIPNDTRAVKIAADGWSVVTKAPVLFRRPATMRALPVPERGGSLDALRGLLNVDDDHFRLLVGWLLAAYQPHIPRPILALFGQQGSAKTTTMRQVVRLVDPSDILTQTMPREDAWGATGNSSYVIGLDNVSSFSPWAQDALCKAITGEAVTKRALYTNNELSTVKFRRAIAMTGITPGKLQGDLADRMLPVEIRPITPGTRRTEADVEATFTAAQPGVFGALLDLLVQVLAVLPSVEPVDLPRMADFALILRALDQVTGWDTSADYLVSRDDAAHAVVAADEFAVSVVTHARATRVWEGTAGQLLGALVPPERPGPGWPKTPEAASAALKRVIPALVTYGVEVTALPRTGHKRGWRITFTTPTDPASTTPTLEQATVTPTPPIVGRADDAAEQVTPDGDGQTAGFFGTAPAAPLTPVQTPAQCRGSSDRERSATAHTRTAVEVGPGSTSAPWCGACGEPLASPGLMARCRPGHQDGRATDTGSDGDADPGG
jgi:hypothetical protein